MGDLKNINKVKQYIANIPMKNIALAIVQEFVRSIIFKLAKMIDNPNITVPVHHKENVPYRNIDSSIINIVKKVDIAD